MRGTGRMGGADRLCPVLRAASIAFGQTGHGRRLEQAAQRYFDLEGFAHARHELGRQQRVAAEVEEIVVDTDTFDVEQLGPEFRQKLFRRRAGRCECLFQLRTRAIRRGQRAAIDFAVGHQRQGIERHEDRRHHVIGQLLLEEATQLVARGVPDHIGRQPPLAGRVFAGLDDGLSHCRVLAKRRLDLSQLDAKSADFHLVVGPGEKLQISVGPITD